MIRFYLRKTREIKIRFQIISSRLREVLSRDAKIVFRIREPIIHIRIIISRLRKVLSGCAETVFQTREEIICIRIIISRGKYMIKKGFSPYLEKKIYKKPRNHPFRASAGPSLPLISLLFSRLLDLFLDDGVDHGDGRQVQDVARGAFHVGEVDRLVEAHLDGADDLSDAHLEQELIGAVGRAEVGEDKRVDVAPVELVEGVHLVAELAVEGEVDLHLAVDQHLRVGLVEVVDGLVDLERAALLVGPEVGVGEHGHDGLVGEELDGVVRQAGDVDQDLGRGVAVDQRVGHEEGALLAGDDVHGPEVLVGGADADDLLGQLVDLGVAAVDAGDEGVGVARLDHHHAEGVAFDHLLAGLGVGDAVAGPFLGEEAGVAVAALGLAVVAEVDDLDALEADVLLGGDLGQAFLVAQEDGDADAQVLGLDGGFQHVDVVGLGEDDAFRVGLGHVGERAEELVVVAHHLAQVVAVTIPVGDRLARDARFDGRLGHGCRDARQEPRVEGLGQDVVAAEGGPFQLVSGVHHVGHRLLGQLGDGVDGGALHLLVDGLGARVERPAEDVGEAQDVVDLVGIVGAAGGEDDVGARGHRVGVGDLRVGVGQGEDDGVGVHAPHHVLRQDVGHAEAEEDVGAGDGLLEGTGVGVDGELALGGVQVGPPGGDDALAVAHEDVLLLGAEGHVELRARDGRRAGAVDDDLDLADVFPGDLEGVDQAGAGDDGRPVLVVVHHGDVQLILEPRLDLETFRGLDVFQVDAAESRGDGLDGLDEFLGILLVDLDVEYVDTREDLEQQSFPFHYRFPGQRADVAQSQNGRPVGDDGDQVALGGILVSVQGFFLDLQARLGHARRVGQREVGLRAVRLGRDNLNLTRLTFGVIPESLFFRNLCHKYFL